MPIFEEDSENDLVVDDQANNADLIIPHDAVRHILAVEGLGVLDDHLIGLAGSTHNTAF